MAPEGKKDHQGILIVTHCQGVDGLRIRKRKFMRCLGPPCKSCHTGKDLRVAPESRPEEDSGNNSASSILSQHI